MSTRTAQVSKVEEQLERLGVNSEELDKIAITVTPYEDSESKCLICDHFVSGVYATRAVYLALAGVEAAMPEDVWEAIAFAKME